MNIVNALAIFCEDIREEKTGQDTLIGLMSDNVGLPSVPAMFPRLGIYVRAYFDPTGTPEPFVATVELPGGQKFEVGPATLELVARAFKEATAQGTPVAGIILKGMFSPLPISAVGTIRVRLKTSTEEKIIGLLNIVVGEPPNPASNVPAPPS